MAEHKTDNYPSGVPPVLRDSVIHGGHVRQIVASFTAPTGGIASGDTIKVCSLPSRSKVVPGFAYVIGGAANVTLELDGYSAATSAPASTYTRFTAKAENPAMLEKETDIVAKVAGTGSIAAGTKLVFGIFFVTA